MKNTPESTTQKTRPRHAFDYLRSLARDEKTPAWLFCLIEKLISTNCQISDAAIESIADAFVSRHLTRDFVSTDEEIKQDSGTTFQRSIVLSSLTHHSGANALQNNARLIFGKDVTIVFGPNGSGKSGYFRILKCACPTSNQSSILPNVYDSAPPPLHVEFEYLKESQKTTAEWNGEAPIQDFGGMLVFDSSYTSGLISKRAVSEATVVPFGLGAFQELTRCVDRFKSAIENRIIALKQQEPPFDIESISQEIRNAVNDGGGSNEEFKKLLDTHSATSMDNHMLETARADLHDCERNDKKDSLRLKQSILSELSLLRDKIGKVFSTHEARVCKWTRCLETYRIAYKNANEAKMRFQLLQALPGHDTETWRTFIQSASVYVQEHDHEVNGICPYCRQPLADASAMSLIKCYSEYLNDESQIRLESELAKIRGFQKCSSFENEFFNISPTLQDELRTIPQEESSLLEAVNKLFHSFHEQEHAFDSAVNEIRDYEGLLVDHSRIDTAIQKQIDRLSAEIKVLEGSEEQRVQRIVELRKTVSILEQKQHVAQNKTGILAWYDHVSLIRMLEKAEKKISSAPVTALSKQAHNELLTTQLMEGFERKFLQFNFPGLRIQLREAGAVKGSTLTELVIKGISRPIPDILSEGEQKAAALAMFLTEAEMNPALGPLVLDDPVNSLDNGVIRAFVEMLLTFNRQIVVFTHNQFFLDCIESEQLKRWHLCKNYENGCNSQGRHVLCWNVQRMRGTSGLLNPAKGEKVINILDEVTSEIQTKQAGADLDSLALKLRRVIEKLVDAYLLNGITPCRCMCGRGHVDWSALKELNDKKEYQETVDQLHRLFSRLSNGDIHENETRVENPLTLDEIDGIAQELMTVAKTKSNENRNTQPEL